MPGVMEAVRRTIGGRRVAYATVMGAFKTVRYRGGKIVTFEVRTRGVRGSRSFGYRIYPDNAIGWAHGENGFASRAAALRAARADVSSG